MSSVKSQAFQPDYAVPPGETLRERLAELNLSQAEVATRANLSAKHVNQIIQGGAPITLETAIILERITGLPASFWNRREADYREGLLRANPRALTEDDERWLSSLPVKELQKRGMLPAEKNRGRLYDAALSFFGVADRSAWQKVWRGPVAAFRRSAAFTSDPGAVVSWLRMAQLEAQGVKAAPYSAVAFRRALQEIRSITAGGDPNRIVELCAEAGVVVVFVSEVNRCRISGAAWWAGPARAVIALSDRYKKDDFFWFTFFHEAAHLLLHSKKETFIDGDADNDMLEDEANHFAANYLIPPEYARRLGTLKTPVDAVAFAKEIGISPGIVVGRLQHDGHWAWGHPGNKLKRSVHIVES